MSDLFFTGGTVIDGTGTEPMPDTAVLIVGDRIRRGGRKPIGWRRTALTCDVSMSPGSRSCQGSSTPTLM